MTNPPNPFQPFAREKYLSIETFRKSGEGVKTPVWFAGTGFDSPSPVIYLYSEVQSGKAKRIRNNPRVRIAPCDIRGNVKGEWVDARAEILEPPAIAEAMRLLNRKYGLVKRILDIFAAFRPNNRIVFAIHPA
jgi:uncharacterized protein